MVKIKGIFKGIKYLTQIFVVKEHEMEIGYPTDVRHVAHIGFESSSVNAPTWMREFKTTSGFSSTSLSDFGGQSRETSWASFDFDQFGQPPGIFTEGYRRPESAAKTPKKTKRKTSKASSSPSSSTTRSSSRSSKSAASSFATAVEEEARQTIIH